MEETQAAEPSEFLEAMRQAADIMLGKRESAGVWHLSQAGEASVNTIGLTEAPAQGEASGTD